MVLIATPNTCGSDQPAPPGLAPSEMLDSLAAAIARAQSALLTGHLPLLEIALADQLALCRRLRSSLPAISPTAGQATAVPAAQCAQQQIRIFSAILRRMQRTLTAFHNVLQAAPLTYAPPSTSGKNWGR